MFYFSVSCIYMQMCPLRTLLALTVTHGSCRKDRDWTVPRTRFFTSPVMQSRCSIQPFSAKYQYVSEQIRAKFMLRWVKTRMQRRHPPAIQESENQT